MSNTIIFICDAYLLHAFPSFIRFPIPFPTIDLRKMICTPPFSPDEHPCSFLAFRSNKARENQWTGINKGVQIIPLTTI